MDTDTDEPMNVEEPSVEPLVEPSVDPMDNTAEEESTIMDDIEEAITAFMEIEQIHTDILHRLEQLSIETTDLNQLKKMHQQAMEHIKSTGSTNFGELLLQ